MSKLTMKYKMIHSFIITMIQITPIHKFLLTKLSIARISPLVAYSLKEILFRYLYTPNPLPRERNRRSIQKRIIKRAHIKNTLPSQLPTQNIITHLPEHVDVNMLESYTLSNSESWKAQWNSTFQLLPPPLGAIEDIDILLRLTQPESDQKNWYVFHHHKNDIVSSNYRRQQLGKERFPSLNSQYFFKHQKSSSIGTHHTHVPSQHKASELHWHTAFKIFYG